MPILKKNILINSRKFDQTVRRSWTADLLEQQHSLLLFKGVFTETVDHKFLGVIRRGTISYEYYWTDEWFNVFRFHEPNGDFRNFYCNLNMPPVFQNNVLDYVDLDIDIIVWKDFSYEIHDLDDFIYNSKKFEYGENLINKVEIELNRLIELIEHRGFPFDTFSN